MEDIQIQIVNYKTKHYLIECLRSVIKDLEGSEIRYSISILDNSSGDDLSDISKIFPGFPITIQASNRNLGFGGGHNFLSRRGDSSYLLFLNPDTKIIEQNTFARLLKRAKESNEQVIGPRLVTDRGNTQRWDHGELRGLRAWIALSSGNSYWKKQNKPIKVAWVSGAVFLVTRKWFVNLGGFDESFFLYKEEEDLCWRIREKGGVIIYDPNITVLHHGGVVAQKSDNMQKSVDYFLIKHFKHKFGYHLYKLMNKIIH